MRHSEEDIRDAGGHVVLVGMGTVEQTHDFVQRFEVPFPMICDPDQHLYRDFSVERMSPLGFFSPTMALRGVGAMAQGHTMGLPEGDVRQLPGVFIVGRDGVILFRHDSRDPSDHPPPSAIIERLRVLASPAGEP